jgi:hypothetical protein
MSSFTTGLSGLILAYATVEVPLAATLIRRGARLGQVVASAALAAPLTIVTGIGIAAINPLVHEFGISSGSFMELAVGVGACVGAGYVAGRLLARPAPPTSVHQRGTVIENTESGLRPGSSSGLKHSSPGMSASRESGCRPERSKVRARTENAITLAGIPVARLDETKHFKLIGTTGTGKSTAIRELLAGALRRGDRAIIADPDGGYLERFKDPARGDIVLNPFDPASVKWDFFGEIENAYDIDQLARSLLPDQGARDPSWINYARTFFSSVTRQAHEAGVTDIRELYNLLVVANTKELRGLLAGTPAQPFLDEHNDRMFDSIRSVTSSAVASLDYIAQQTASPFSIRRWIRDGAPTREGTPKREGAATRGEASTGGGAPNGGVLFIPYKAGQIAALRSTISAWMRIAIFESMSQPEGDQRLWFVVDELDALGQIDGLKDALARLRKFGGRCVLGFQSIAQVSSTYGKGEAQTIVENCGNTLILRCSGSDQGGTAHFASRLIGQREVLRTSRSRSRRPTELLSSTTLSEHIGIEPAVMDSQIEQLPDLAGYLKFASEPHWQRVRLPVPDSCADTRARAEATRFWSQWRSSNASTTRNPSPERTADRTSEARKAPREGAEYD